METRRGVELQQHKDLEEQEPRVLVTPAVPNNEKSVLVSGIGHGFQVSAGFSSSGIAQDGSFSGNLNSSLNGLSGGGSVQFLGSQEMETPSFASQTHTYSNVILQSTPFGNTTAGTSQILNDNLPLSDDPTQARNMTGSIVVLPAGLTNVGIPTWQPSSFCETGPSLAPITPGKDMHESGHYQQSYLVHQVGNAGGKQDTIMLEHMAEETVEHGSTKAEVPITPDKCERIQDCFPHVVIDLAGKGLLEEAKMPQTSGLLDQTEKVANEISEPGSSAPRQDELHKQTSATSSQQLGTEKDEKIEIPGVNFSSTPRQKKRRQKHRPKVILEGNMSRTPKPATPKPVRKPENQTGKRSYVRKKRSLNSLDSPSDTVEEIHLISSSGGIGEVANPHMEINTKSVRRKLNFEYKDQAIDGQPESTVTNAESHIKERLLCTEDPSSRTTSSVLLQQGLQVEVENSPAGIAFDLSRSLNKVLNEYMNLPEDSSSPSGYSRKETLKTTLNCVSESPEFAQMLSVQGGRTKKKRSLRVRKSSLIATNLSSNLFLPTQHTSPQSCMEALFATTYVKIKTKKRTRKGQAHSLSSILSTDDLHNKILTGNYSHRKFVGPTAVGGDSQEQSLQDTDISSNSGRELPHANLPSRAIVSYVDPIEDIERRLKQLQVNPEHVHATAESQNALVPYGNSVMVPYEGPFDTVKKQRPRAKVNLDDETNRVWKLLMGKEASGPTEGSDINKEKWWEKERQVFHGRASSFIARMRLVQGDRHFSPWKGSVLDSVVGVFLTQNVSDHLSSSAFLALAAKFPLCSKADSTKQDAANMSTFDDTSRQENMQGTKGQHQDPLMIHDEECREDMGTTIPNKSLRSDITGQKVDEQDGKGLDVHQQNDIGPQAQEFGLDTTMELIGTIESKDIQLQEDVVSSQGSASSPESTLDRLIEMNNQLKSRLESSSGAVLVPGTTFSSSEGFALQELGNSGNGKISLAENHCTIEKTRGNNRLYQSEDSCHSTIYATNINLHHLQHGISESEFPPSPCSHNSSSSLTEGMENTSALREKSTCDTPSDSCTTKISNLKIVDCNCRSSSELTTKTAANSHQEENKADFHGNNVQQAFKASDKIQDFKVHESSSKSSYNGQGKNCKADEPNFAKEGSSSQNGPIAMATDKLKVRKGKTASEKMQSFDWDNLRRQACIKGYKKERSFERNDSLDWEAVRCAEVHEISEAIRERGMNNVLAARIKDLLNRLIRDHGSIDLEWLRDIPPDKAKDYLLSIRGLGLKSVECVRLLTLHHLAFPVDTNVGRICVRLGWVPLQPLPESLQLHLLELYPMLEKIQKYLWPRLCKLDQQTLYELHYQMITFGKVFCTKSKPNCNACPMRGECKHFASAFASARLALPGPEEKTLVSSRNPIRSQNYNVPVFNLMPLPQVEGSIYPTGAYVNNSEPIIEEPRSPEVECTETLESEIEDTFDEDPDAIPVIKLNLEEFAQNIENCIKENNKELQAEDIVRSLVVITSEAASIPMPKLKNVSRLRTEHQVYELPDSHLLLKMLDLDEREPDDPCPYLLTIWMPGETAQSTEPPETCCNSQDTGELCDNETCYACCSVRESQDQKVRGTILIPCRTATRGSFPLNGTYFQVNEVFADHYSSHNPIDVPRNWIWNLQRRTVYFGTSIPTIFRGLTTESIQYCFWKGFVCVRGFDRSMRAPRPLCPRLHLAASKMQKGKKTPTKEETRS
ncbi:protein ROS1C isoform X2 [Typha angustifolia]|uniref:protein ROS1C isoform X2 n=1 Tax=Typha angustifolia TaxID=59011 RepID=UPI003C30CDB7